MGKLESLMELRNNTCLLYTSDAADDLICYFTPIYMHFCDREVLTKGSLTLTLMPYFLFFGGIYYSISLGFLVCPCNEPLVGDTQTKQS